MTIRSILCPVDFSATSEEALRYAVSLATRLGTNEVHVLHVHQPPIAVGPEGGPPPAAWGEARRQAAHELEDLTKRYSAHGVVVTPHLEDGVPYQTIVDRAEKLGVDLVVMGTHGRGALMTFLLGSVAERVVRLSRAPVCTVRTPS
jgi:nucleotide-binding universal stress UspA family protein